MDKRKAAITIKNILTEAGKWPDNIAPNAVIEITEGDGVGEKIMDAGMTVSFLRAHKLGVVRSDGLGGYLDLTTIAEAAARPGPSVGGR